MIYWFCSRDIQNTFTWNKLEHAVRRNFSGLDLDPAEPFEILLKKNDPIENIELDTDPRCKPIDLVQAALRGENVESNSRYLLLLTENYAVLDIVQNYLINVVKVPSHNLVVIFGSSFRHDQEYTEVCRNISRIKHSMEIGNTVILLNFDNLYESLYDALNQYYHWFAGQKFVDLGLGTHRVKCSVHDNFRLIVIAEKKSVYDTKRFPIPLINRLEKHYLSASTMLNEQQLLMVNTIKKWVEVFSKGGNQGGGSQLNNPTETFIGYHNDTVPTLVLHLTQLLSSISMETQSLSTTGTVIDEKQMDGVISDAKRILLQCATSDCVARLNSNANFGINKDEIWNEYFVKQKHSSLREMIEYHLISNNGDNQVIGTTALSKHLLQISTHSKLLLTKNDVSQLAKGLNLSNSSVSSCLLNSLDTQQQLKNTIKDFFTQSSESEPMMVDETTTKISQLSSTNRILLIQSDLSEKSAFDLISCARHVIVEESKTHINLLNNAFIVLIVNVPRENVTMFSGFQVSYWSCYHVDDLEELPKDMPTFEILKQKKLSELLQDSLAYIESIENTEMAVDNVDEIVNQKPSNCRLEIKSWLEKSIYAACSFIKDDILNRTVDRVKLFNKLCSIEDAKFFKCIAKRLTDLQIEREQSTVQSFNQNWLIKAVAAITNVKQNSTLRKACQTYIENRLSQLLGYILSYIDNYYNLDVLNEAWESKDSKWKYNLWLSILNSNQIVDFQYNNMLSKGDQPTELKQFPCKSQWTMTVIKDDYNVNSSKNFMKPKIPFFWLLTSTLSDLYENHLQSNRGLASTTDTNIPPSPGAVLSTELQYQQYKQTICHLFEKTPIYSVIYKDTLMNSDNETISVREQFLNEYINDFILFNCRLTSSEDLMIITNVINQTFKRYRVEKTDIRLSLPMIHFEYEKVREKIDIYLKFVQLQPNISKTLLKSQTLEANAMNRDIDLDACLECMKEFKSKLSTNNINDIRKSTKQLGVIVQLVNSLMVSHNNQETNEKLTKINQEYQILKALNLLIENVLFPIGDADHTNELTLINVPQLCSRFLNFYVKENVNFKDKTTVEALHNYIVYCVTHARGTFFGCGSESKCCEKVKQNYVMVSDCKCVVCSDCSLMVGLKKCLICKGPITKQTTYTPLEVIKQKPFKDFQDILNKFYVEIIEYLVFDDQSHNFVTVDSSKTPIPAILKVITESKISGQDTHNCLTITPAYLPLLLQILFKTYSKDVQEKLKEWFGMKSITSGHALNMFENTNNLAVFFINCVYDQLLNASVEYNAIERINLAIRTCDQLLNDGISSLFEVMSNHYEVNLLYKVAQFKYVIDIMGQEAANYMTTDDRTKKFVLNLNKRIQKIVEGCNKHTKTVHNYLLKVIIRRFGSGSVRTISKIDELKWMTPVDMVGTDDKTDRYVLIGSKYTTIKKLVKDTIGENKPHLLSEHLNQATKDIFVFQYLCLALYREVGLLHRIVENKDTIPIELFERVLTQSSFSTDNDRNVWDPIINNKFTHNLQINKDTNVDLSSIILQFKLSILYSKSKLMKPFNDLITNPIILRDSYLPTMPQDYLFDVFRALIEGRHYDNPKFYQCPNGHPYVLFDCGRPWVVYKCKECNADIGGTGHKLLETNRELNVSDRTIKGYCLSDASTINDTPITDRLLGHSSFHVTRFFLHCGLYLACDKDETAVKYMMMKETPNLKDFFWKHMQKDLTLIMKTLNMNLDEVYILLHHMINSMLVDSKVVLYDRWTSKDDRTSWEKTFNEHYLLSTFKNSSYIISKATRDMQKDAENDIGNARLYFMAYELVTEPDLNTLCPYENEQFWKFRPTVSFASMSIQLTLDSAEPMEYKVLKKFIELKDKLEIVFYLPDIVKLINILEKYLSKVIYKDFARKCTLHDCINSQTYFPNSTIREEISACVKKFDTAWKMAKAHISSHLKKILPISEFTFDQDFSFTLDTTVSHFLPSKYGDGLGCYGLLHYLSSIHNEFLSFYKSAYGRTIAEQQQLDELNIALFENSEFIINFDTKGSLLRIIISNVRYDAKESKCIFSYDKIEKQIINKYLQTKSKIDMETIKTFEYSDEMSELETLIKLNDTIKQENIEPYTQKTIFESYEQINEASEALHMLKTIINFASTTSANADTKLYDFVHLIYVNNEYKNPDLILKSRVLESCQLKHLKHLWLIISLKKAILFTINNQDPFELLEDIFRRNPEGASEHHEIYNGNELNTISMLLVLYQYINFVLCNVKTDNDREYPRQYSLRDTFLVLDTDSTILFPDNMPPAQIARLFDESIKGAHVFYAWKNLAHQICH